MWADTHCQITQNALHICLELRAAGREVINCWRSSCGDDENENDENVKRDWRLHPLLVGQDYSQRCLIALNISKSWESADKSFAKDIVDVARGLAALIV